MAIKSFACKHTAALFARERVRQFVNIERVALRKLKMVHAAARLEDLKSPPGNKLHPLTKDRAGQHAIWINDQFRVCFRWNDGDAYDVEITDYHD
ncbi:MAG: type II toxin-antitoxin system RelE/ParE family toxin [Pseudomonadota bacterium]